MTLAEFEADMADGHGFPTVAAMHDQGRYGIPCECDYKKCEGWQLTVPDELVDRVYALWYGLWWGLRWFTFGAYGTSVRVQET